MAKIGKAVECAIRFISSYTFETIKLFHHYLSVVFKGHTKAFNAGLNSVKSSSSSNL